MFLLWLILLILPLVTLVILAAGIGSLFHLLRKSVLKRRRAQRRYLFASGATILTLAIAAVVFRITYVAHEPSIEDALIWPNLAGLFAGWLSGVFWYLGQARQSDHHTTSASAQDYWRQ